MSTYQHWLGRFAVGASNDSFTVDATAKTCTAGNYYLFGYTSESTVQFIEHMEDLIAAVVASSTVTYSTTTERVTIAWGSNSHALTWTDTDLRDLLGFTTNLASGAGPYTATNAPRYLWAPNRGFTSTPVISSRVYAPISSTVVHCSRDGTLTTVRGNTRYAGEVEYQLLDGTRVFVPATGSVNKELEKFFEDVIAAGELIRVYPDRSLNASTSYVTVKACVPGEPIGSFEDWAARHISSYDGLADVRIPLAKYVA